MPPIDDPMHIRLGDERRQSIRLSLQTLYFEDFDEDLSDFRADRIVDFFVRALGPSVYNQAIQDARAFLTDKLDDLAGEFYELEPK